MATANILPAYARLSQRILSVVVPRPETGSTEFVRGLDLLWLMLKCPAHTWSWPRSNKEERFKGYDAHQTCCKCASRRLFDTREWQSGPIYKRGVRAL